MKDLNMNPKYYNAKDLRNKESDRIKTIVDTFLSLGGKITYSTKVEKIVKKCKKVFTKTHRQNPRAVL